jgi:putative membrane protein (TIGR04086 family)
MKILKALIGAYVITMIGLFVLAFVLYKFQLKENIIQIGIIVVYILSNLVGGIIVGKSVGSKRYLAGILLGICYFALLTAASLIMKGEAYSQVGNSITIFAICVGSGMFGGMIS